MTPKFVFGKEKNDWIKRPLLSNIEKILDYRGRTPKKLGLSWSDTGFLALSALNVKNGYIDFNADANYGDQELYNRWMGDNNLHKGQVVFTTEAPMGNVAQIPNDALYILSQRTIAFEVKHHLIREDFLATLLRSPKIFNELTSLSSGGTAKGISQKSLSNLKISLPASLDEQSAIGSLFRTLDDLLASYKDNLANYQSLKATMLSKMFPKAGQTIPEIRLDGFEGEWKEKTLGSLGSVAMNKRIFKNETSENGGIPFYKIGTFGGTADAFISKEKFKEYKEKYPYPEIGDILISASGSIGRTVVYNGEDAYYQDSNIVWLKHDQQLDNSYLKQYYGIIKWSGIEGTTIKRLYNKNILETKIFLPPSVTEQQAIGTYFSNLDNLINSYQEKISQLETLKKKLLQDMFI